MLDIFQRKENLGEILEVMREKRVERQSMDTAKHKVPKFVFDPANQKLVDFLYEFQRLAKDLIGSVAQAIIEQIKNSKLPPHLQKLIN